MADSSIETGPSAEVIGEVDSAAKLLSVLFGPPDILLLRPIESWIEDGKKRSLVDFKNTQFCGPSQAQLNAILVRQMKAAEQNRTNLFFGVCPRFGRKRRYDLAWQIRTVRTLWTDVDQVSVVDALSRVSRAGLPAPSIVVNSGNGAHLYWLLDQPYLIDDVGNPPAVETEWNEDLARRMPRKYILKNDERVYLNQKQYGDQSRCDNAVRGNAAGTSCTGQASDGGGED